MPAVKIGKYKRPGIYIEEFDSSLIETPEITGLQSMVIGSSKKGPVNVPITLNSQSDLQRIFGDLDRNLESKGSYFHRTISKLLEGSPVVAINLLNPDDDLDKLEYKSLSTSSEYNNDIKREQSYRRFFDTSTFWKRDREAFLAITKENVSDENRIMHLTNLNDKEVTVFIVKASNTTGYDKSLLEWYGNVNKVPFFVDPKDYASDYMVDVVILDGNWTNYSSLSVDPTWSRYFNNSGLIKSELFNLADNPSVNNLYSWRGLSLIPYFRDIQGTNIFIETRINERTDRTGLYCAFDIDAVETDYRNGLIDLLGSSLIGSVDEFGKPTTDIPNSIEFLSYKEDITEIKSYGEVSLDTPGNVYQLTFDSTYQNASGRTAMYAEGYINNFKYNDTTLPTEFGFVSADGVNNGYVVIGGEEIELENKVFEPSDFPFTSGTVSSFDKTFFIDTDGGIKMDPSPTQLQVGVVLGTMSFNIDVNGDFASVSYTPINLDGSGFVYFNDYFADIGTPSITNDSITYEFLDTMGSVYPDDLREYRRLKVYNQLVGILNNPNKDKATILIGEDDKKLSLKNLEISIPNNVYSNKTITISGFESGFDFTYLENNGLVLHVIDNELVMGAEGLMTTDEYISGNVGIVSEWSDLYQDYFNGLINTGDKFYENIANGVAMSWIKFADVAGNDYIIIDNQIPFIVNQEIIIPDATLNKGSFKISNPNPLDISGMTASFADLTSGYAYEVVEDTVPETINNPTKIWSVDDTFYTKFYIIDDILNVSFNGSSTGGTNNKILDIISQNSNFRQTVEIEMPTGYVRPSNVILADASRYTEIKIGDFLEAWVDPSIPLQNGEKPRRMTRVLSKKIYKGDPNLVEISCDSAINVHDFGGDLQTFRFTQIEDYVSTYKGISLKGFRLRPDSLPNGTDDRLNEITRIIGKGTPMFNSLVDKDVIDFRYLVDSYGLGLTELSKQVFADICGKRLDTFGILNMPSMTDFRKSSSPSFVDDEGRLSTELIAMGGDPNSSPAFNYSLAEGDGISCVGYFTPYVVVNDNGRPKNVPPAAWVATSFLRKHNSALTSVTPWTIVAGITDGQVTGIAGLEYTFNGTDIENLNGMSVNPIVSKRNRGRVIETENTAQTLKTSALSFIHVREVLIELERDLADMLLQFQWKYNTPEIRAEIKLRADAICEDYVNRNGLYNFFNKIDSENNTPDIIDHQMGVLDTFVEPIKGMGVIVNNVTILRTGAINSGGFL